LFLLPFPREDEGRRGTLFVTFGINDVSVSHRDKSWERARGRSREASAREKQIGDLRAWEIYPRSSIDPARGKLRRRPLNRSSLSLISSGRMTGRTGRKERAKAERQRVRPRKNSAALIIAYYPHRHEWGTEIEMKTGEGHARVSGITQAWR